MSKTIRDNAQQAALSMLAKEVFYATVRFQNANYQSPELVGDATKKGAVTNTYMVKVAGSVLDNLIVRLEDNRKAMVDQAEEKMPELLDTRPLSIETLISSGTQTSRPAKKRDRRIFGFVERSTESPNNYAIVEVIELKTYTAISDLTVPISQLKYLTGLIDPTPSDLSQERENQVVNKITEKLQAQAGADFAVSLLGIDAYTELTQELTVDNQDKTV